MITDITTFPCFQSEPCNRMISGLITGQFSFLTFWEKSIYEARGQQPRVSIFNCVAAYVKSVMAEYNLLHLIVLMPLSLNQRFSKDPLGVSEIL